MLCESCQQKEATCHITIIEGGISKSRDLCDKCYAAGSSEAAAFVAAQHQARCEYCGGQPCAGGTDIFAMIMGVQKLKFMCMPCSTEHNRYIQQQMQQDVSGLSQHEQLLLLRTLNDEADKHMKHWVLERGSQ